MIPELCLRCVPNGTFYSPCVTAHLRKLKNLPTVSQRVCCVVARSLNVSCSLLPSPVCKFVSIEMKSAFQETGKTKAVIDRTYNFIDGKGAPPVQYVKS